MKKLTDIVKKGIEILVNLTHRGAVGSDPKTGDGAGIMLQIPDEFFRITCDNLGIELPEAGKYAVGMVFLPKETSTFRLNVKEFLKELLKKKDKKF